MITIEVPAVPIAQPRQRTRIVGKFTQNYTPSKHPVQDFKATVRLAARVAYDGAPMDGPLSVRLTFVMPRPSNLIWKTRAMPRVPHAKKPDADNLAKSVFDSLNGLLWVDDSQLCDVGIEKWIASGDEQPHVTVVIQQLKQAEATR